VLNLTVVNITLRYRVVEVTRSRNFSERENIYIYIYISVYISVYLEEMSERPIDKLLFQVFTLFILSPIEINKSR
jgi:hypothetical protein